MSDEQLWARQAVLQAEAAAILADLDVVGFHYRDERGPRSPAGTARDERYHVVIDLVRPERTWRIDLTLWLNDPHRNITAWHESLRDSITADQRGAILRIKDEWCRLPGYPDRIGGTQ